MIGDVTRQTWKRAVIVLLLLAGTAFGQIQYSYSARNLRSGTTLPATCRVGDVFFDSDATVGENFYGCTAVNTWTLLSGVFATDPTACVLGSVVSDIAADGTLTCVTNIATATALAANPTACAAGSVVSDIAADGTLTCTGAGVAGITYYLDDDASGIGTYNTLRKVPDVVTVEDEDDVNIDSGDGEQLIDGYATELNVPGTGIIPGGKWQFDTYARVDSDVGSTYVKIYVASVAIGGAETPQFNVTLPVIEGNTATLYTVQYISSDIIIDPTDRLLVKYYGYTSSGPALTVSIFHNGTTNYSHVSTPLIGGVSGAPPVVQCDGASGNDTYTCVGNISAYSEGEVYLFDPDVNNTGAASLNINSVGAVSIKVLSGGSLADPADNFIDADAKYNFVYDGTYFVVVPMDATPRQPLDAALTALAAGSDFVDFTGPASSAKTFTLPDADATISYTVASGTATLNTAEIASTACATVVTETATGTATTDIITWTPNADIIAVTGYAPVTTGGLAIYPYPSSNNVNFKVCNPTNAAITPGAVTLNWRVIR